MLIHFPDCIVTDYLQIDLKVSSYKVSGGFGMSEKNIAKHMTQTG